MNTKKERTGDIYGAVTVIGHSNGKWAIRWKCCDKEETVTSKRVSDLERSPVKRCISCIKATPKSTAAEKAAANRSRNKMVVKKEEPTVFTEIQGYWPYLTKMGHRHL